MVTTRSGTVFKASPNKRHRSPTRKQLLSRHIRTRGDDSAEACKICLKELWVTYGACDSLLQCPFCSNVSHAACIFKYVKNAEYEPKCLNCMCSIQDLDDWAFTIDVFDSEDEDFECKSEQSEEESSSESNDSSIKSMSDESNGSNDSESDDFMDSESAESPASDT